MVIGRRMAGPALLAAAALLLAAAPAQAADCKALTNPLYVAGSSAVKPLLVQLGTALAKANPPVTLVYQSQGSCTGVAAIVDKTTIKGTGTHWSPSASGDQTCDLDLAGTKVDVGVSDVFAESCPGVTKPASVGDFFGPVQVMTFVVPAASSQTSISAEAAYLTFGLGLNGAASPWTDEAQTFCRSETSGTQQMLAKAIGVPANKWSFCSSQKGSGDVLSAVAASTSPEKAIGILAADVADGNRDKVKRLALQSYGQTCGFWPDSSPTAFDKASVRDGHYNAWGPLHFLTDVGADAKPTNALAAQVIGYFTGDTEPPADIDLLALEAKAYTVPPCAMHVRRDSEIGPLMSVAPAKACGCAFESKLGTPSASCQACTADSACPSATPHCNFGFCEAS